MLHMCQILIYYSLGQDLKSVDTLARPRCVEGRRSEMKWKHICETVKILNWNYLFDWKRLIGAFDEEQSCVIS